MKKLWILVACLTVCVSLAACGTQPASSTPDSSVSSNTETTPPESKTTDPADPQTTAPESKTTDPADTQTTAPGSQTMESFIASMKDELDQMSAAMESSGMTLSVSARGKSLVYSYKYTIDVGDLSLIKPTLEQMMDSLSSTFEGVLSSLRLVVPDAQSVIVEYLDKDGQVIVSKEYK